MQSRFNLRRLTIAALACLQMMLCGANVSFAMPVSWNSVDEEVVRVKPAELQWFKQTVSVKEQAFYEPEKGNWKKEGGIRQGFDVVYAEVLKDIAESTRYQSSKPVFKNAVGELTVILVAVEKSPALAWAWPLQAYKDKKGQQHYINNRITINGSVYNYEKEGFPDAYCIIAPSRGNKDYQDHNTVIFYGFAKGYGINIELNCPDPAPTPAQMLKFVSPYLERLPELKLPGVAAKTSDAATKQGGTLSKKDLAIATAASTLLLALAALMQLMTQGPLINPGNWPLSGGKSGGAPNSGPPVNAQGQVYFQPPWDKGGAYWMNRDEYENVQRMQRAGKQWDDKWGWVDDAALRERQAGDQAWRAANQAMDQRNQEDAAAIRATQAAIRAGQERVATNEKIAELWAKQRLLEASAAKEAADAARLERVGKMAEAVQCAADNSINILSGFAGPGGDAFRRGYYVLKGAAGGLGEAIAEGKNIIGHVAKGAGRGAFEAAADYGVEKGIHALGGLKKSMFSENVVATPISGELGRTKNALTGALSTADPLQRAQNVRTLYKGGGMTRLAELEGAGHLTAQQVRECNRIITADVEGAIQQGTKKTVSEFADRTGVSVSEVLVGDSGSSAQSAMTRSINSDADRTLVASFKQDELAAYAKKHCGGDMAAAHNELSEQLTRIHQQAVDAQLNEVGLSAKDVGYTSYNRLGSHSGQLDSYPDGFTYTRQSVQGQTTVYKFDDAGGLKHSYKTSGQTLLDQEALNVRRTTGELPEMTPRIGSEEYADIVKLQQDSLLKHSDAKSVAKALERVNYTGERLGNPIDDKLMEMAMAIRKNPNETAAVLQGGGMNKEEFYKQASQAVDRYAEWLSKVRGE